MQHARTSARMPRPKKFWMQSMRSVHISSVMAGFTCATGPRHQGGALQPCGCDCASARSHADLHAALALPLVSRTCGPFAAISHKVLLDSTAQRGMMQLARG